MTIDLRSQFCKIYFFTHFVIIFRGRKSRRAKAWTNNLAVVGNSEKAPNDGIEVDIDSNDNISAVPSAASTILKG